MIPEILIFLGACFIFIAALGLLRFRDLFSRLHATTKATSFGILLILIGVSLHFATWVVFLKSLLIILFIFLTAPLAAHSISKSGGMRAPEGEEAETANKNSP
jgi:multicomponent Na+:H+ antiporter subunit G